MLVLLLVLAALTLNLGAVQCHTGKCLFKSSETVSLRLHECSHILHGEVTISLPMAPCRSTTCLPQARIMLTARKRSPTGE
jgi:hypothetical protein